MSDRNEPNAFGEDPFIQSYYFDQSDRFQSHFNLMPTSTEELVYDLEMQYDLPQILSLSMHIDPDMLDYAEVQADPSGNPDYPMPNMDEMPDYPDEHVGPFGDLSYPVPSLEEMLNHPEEQADPSPTPSHHMSTNPQDITQPSEGNMYGLERTSAQGEVTHASSKHPTTTPTNPTPQPQASHPYCPRIRHRQYTWSPLKLFKLHWLPFTDPLTKQPNSLHTPRFALLLHPEHNEQWNYLRHLMEQYPNMVANDMQEIHPGFENPDAWNAWYAEHFSLQHGRIMPDCSGQYGCSLNLYLHIERYKAMEAKGGIDQFLVDGVLPTPPEFPIQAAEVLSACSPVQNEFEFEFEFEVIPSQCYYSSQAWL
ncbi:hypothetical protein IAQ61_003639 [Plenodomus lingam]|uniref:Predicted protein n=1 Tax=Leptosphaeria maculans (strain JN3 / isolate v23.1.3 / race Av1-4-5-6-7-8) TaxID=985895 RepID=E4ZR86_LEPMJ|nr:predicted protein [Plenodomus lingam JN3]KAH9874450.1 hypothetical protein IAQ61_003639 [Plenodomus lingam]CBX93751.1 predicted protein [Plenodomus lingam JN3]